MIDDEFWDRLGAKYRGRANAWEQEKSKVQQAIADIELRIADRYQIETPIGIGGAGITLLLKDRELSTDAYTAHAVLKLPRPSDSNNAIAYRETERLAMVRHPNIMKIVSRQQTPQGINYYIMEHLEGVKDAHEYIVTNSCNEDDLLRVALGTARGLAHMHSRLEPLVHSDIKPENIFCAANGDVVVADFGFTKVVARESRNTEMVGGTHGYKHPRFERLLRQLGEDKLSYSDPAREMTKPTIQIDSSELDPIFDMYSLGLTFLILLRFLELVNPKGVSRYFHRYFKLLAHRMLDGNLPEARRGVEEILDSLKNEDWFPAAIDTRPIVDFDVAGFNQHSIKSVSYRSIDEVVSDLEKVSGQHNIAAAVPEMKHSVPDTIQVSSHGPTPFTPRVRELLKTAELSALEKIDQLGLVRLVYPVASHSRLEHTLGTFNMTVRYARALYDDPLSPAFRQFMSSQDLATLFVCSLVHDCGHYPLAHDLEEVDNSVFSHVKRGENLLRSDSSINRILSAPHTSEGDLGWGVDVETVRRVLFEPISSLSFKESLMRSIIDGPIDADKLDYLTRDSENLRLPYGRGIDVMKLTQSLTVLINSTGARARGHIGIHDKGRIPAESLAFARYALYGSVYWHRTHRTVKAMLSRIALKVCHDYAIRHGDQQWRRALGTELKKQLDIASVGGESPVQGVLFGESKPVPEQYPIVYLDAATISLIKWLVREAGESYRELGRLLIQRTLYKKVLVATRSRTENVELWRKIDSIYSGLGENSLQRFDLVEHLQTSIADRVKDWNQSTPSIETGVPTTVVSEFIVRSASEPLVIIDYPPTKDGASRGLEFLREDEWSGASPGSLSISSPIETSSVWVALAEQQRVSTGKLRVFIHPRFARLVRQALGRDEVMALLVDALDAVADGRRPRQ